MKIITKLISTITKLISTITKLISTITNTHNKLKSNIIEANIHIYLAMLKMTNLGTRTVPNELHGMNNHFGVIIPYQNKLYTHILTSNNTPSIGTYNFKAYFIHLPNIRGNLYKQYLWSPSYRINEKLFTMSKQPVADQYLIDHYDKFQYVLNQIHPKGFTPQLAIDLVSQLPHYLQ